jgi:hypothetical protein
MPIKPNYRTNKIKLLKALERLVHSADPTEAFHYLTDNLDLILENTDGSPAGSVVSVADEALPEASDDEIADEENTKLPRLRSIGELKSLDLLSRTLTEDEELMAFLISSRVAAVWQAVLEEDEDITVERLRDEQGGPYFEQIRRLFFAQYEGATNLAIPEGYSFTKDGRPATPNLMQKLIAHRLRTEQRVGNWSGTGAGKTLSAVLASRVIDAHLTLVVAANATLETWARTIRETYPDSVVYIKERELPEIDPVQHTYLVLNYESFQQPWSAAFVSALTGKHHIKFIVLDEIQLSRRRNHSAESLRRRILSGLLAEAASNPDLHVLGLSATPLINDLHEARSLLELVTSLDFNDLETYPVVRNAIRIHEKLIVHGLRFRPRYTQTVEERFIEIDGRPHVEAIRAVPPRGLLEMERALLEIKRPALSDLVRPGTLFFTNFVTGIIPLLTDLVTDAGCRVGVYTGEEKSGLEDFLRGEVDVLIGSTPIATGVDGLQRVCNRLVFVNLPWTSAEYEQIIGRLHRQGSVFDKIEVVILQVVLRDGDRVWSYDVRRLQRVRYKRTLADAAVDGIIPQGELTSPEFMQQQSLRALEEWLSGWSGERRQA